MRPRYYTKPEGRDVVRDGRGLSYDAYDFSPFPFSAHQFFYPTRFCNKVFSTVQQKETNKLGYIARLRRLYQAGVLQKADLAQLCCAGGGRKAGNALGGQESGDSG